MIDTQVQPCFDLPLGAEKSLTADIRIMDLFRDGKTEIAKLSTSAELVKTISGLSGSTTVLVKEGKNCLYDFFYLKYILPSNEAASLLEVKARCKREKGEPIDERVGIVIIETAP